MHTDILILLMDLVSQVGGFTVLTFLTGEGAKYRPVNECDMVTTVGLFKENNYNMPVQ